MAQKTNKQIELELIKKLYDLGGYFAAAFTQADVDLMERNIIGDFDLLCGTSRDDSRQIGDLQRELKATYDQLADATKLASGLTVERDAAISNFHSSQAENDDLREQLYEKAHDIERLKFQIIRRDLQLGNDLKPEQIQDLIEDLEGYED